MKLIELFISPDASLVEALEKLDEVASRILIVVDESFALRGVLTDGDARRCILKTGALDASVGDACNTEPYVIYEGQERDAPALMRRYDLDAVPVVNENGIVVDCILKGGECAEKTMGRINVPVVMMAGGLGTRLYPYTKVLPKPLIPVNDVPIAERIIRSFQKQGCGPFFLVINHKKEMIKAYFKEIECSYDVRFVEEAEFLGTGGGLSLVKEHLDGSFILTNCDILVEADFSEALALHREKKNAVTMVVSLKNYVIPYGTVEIDAGGGIAGMVEKPSIPFLINTGCYIVERCVLDLIDEGESVGFPDIINRCKEEGFAVGVYPVSESSWLDMGQPEELARMSLVLEER